MWCKPRHCLRPGEFCVRCDARFFQDAGEVITGLRAEQKVRLQDRSGSAALVHAISPSVAIVDNGARKGGSPSALDIIKSSPDLWAM